MVSQSVRVAGAVAVVNHGKELHQKDADRANEKKVVSVALMPKLTLSD